MKLKEFFFYCFHRINQMTFVFLFDMVGLVIYGLDIFRVQQIVEGFLFLGVLFYGVGVVGWLFGCCFVFL